MGKNKPEMRTCTKCGETKNLREGFKEIRSAGRWQSWCHQCEGKKTARDYEKNRKGMRREKVPCRGCGEEVGVMLEEGTKAPPMYCEQCKEVGPPEQRGGFGGARIREACNRVKPVPRDISDVIVYRPGTPEFRRVVEAITPVWQVRPAGGMTAPGEASSNRFIV